MAANSEFDAKAREWDLNPMHLERSKAIAEEMLREIPFSQDLKALEFGAGTGLLSFLLYDRAGSITMADNSEEMTRVMQEKIESRGVGNLQVIHADLEHEDLPEKFGLIFSQMVLHHVREPEKILEKFADMLNPGGYLAIADLYPEDGSFHGEGVNVHLGFDPVVLAEKLQAFGCIVTRLNKVFEIRRQAEGSDVKIFPVFLLVVQRQPGR